MYKANYSKLHELDWDFPGDRCASLFSGAHWYPARFVAQIPASLLGLLSKKDDWILDPYCGSGTTIVEAMRLGRNGYGVDVNPVAIDISRGKTQRMRAIDIDQHVSTLITSILETLEYGHASKEPDTVQGGKWYHPETLRELCAIWHSISELQPSVGAVARTAFSGALLSVTNETRHWGYICDNTRPLAIRRVNAIQEFRRRLENLVEAYRARDEWMANAEIEGFPEVVLECQDAVRAVRAIESEAIDLVVTSPPYHGVCDYIKAQRLSMEWCGYDIEMFRRQELGARSKRRRMTAYADYMCDLKRTVVEMVRVLKPGGHIAMVLGESRAREPFVRPVIDFLKECGVSIVLDKERQISRQRRQHPSVEQEAIVVGRK